MKNTLVFGAKGFVGRRFYRYYQSLYPNVAGTHYLPAEGLHLLDLERPDLSSLQIPFQNYEYAIIASGTSPSFCEKNPEQTHQINVENVLSLCKQLILNGITPILFCTGYVFDGMVGNYDEEALTNPLNVYGKQKAELAESLEREFRGHYINVRLGKVYGMEKGDGTLIDEIVSSLTQTKAMRLAADQFFSPISIGDVLRGVEKLKEISYRGLIHLGGRKRLSRYELGLSVVKALGKSTRELIQSVNLDDLAASFLRPKDTSISSSKFFELTGNTTTSCEVAIECLAGKYIDTVLR